MVQIKTDKHPKLIRLPEVKRRTGYGKTWIYTLIREGKFPKQVKTGLRSIAFIESEILKSKFKLLDGICKEVVALLAEKQVPKAIFSILKKMKSDRQIEAVSTMISINNFSKKILLINF